MSNVSLASIYTDLLLFSGVVSIFVGIAVWQRRKHAPEAAPLLAFLLGMLIWALTYALHWHAVNPAVKSFWLDMTYLGVAIVPTAGFLFALQFTNPANPLKKFPLALLLIEPALTLSLLWTDPYHNLFYGGLHNPLQSQIFNGGPIFWVNVIYTYAIELGTIIMVVIAANRSGRLFSQQARPILIGLSFPIVANLISFAGLNPLTGLDLTPIAFTFTGFFLALGLFRSHMLELVPVGREVLVENMHEGMILINPQQRILDLNPAAKKLLSLPGTSLVGTSIHTTLQAYPELITRLVEKQVGMLEIHFPDSPVAYLDILIQPTRDSKTGQENSLVICRDITRLKTAENHLRSQLEQIEALQNDLREQALRDPLTGLHNRRYLSETLPLELLRTEHDHEPTCVILLDLDDFKHLNDNYGHLAGDEVLRQLGDLLSKKTRRSDIVTRFGGEEFLLVLLNTPKTTAFERSNQIRADFAALTIPFAEHELKSTFSAGVAAFPEDGTTAEELIQMADKALYIAKLSGKNRVYAYSPELPASPRLPDPAESLFLAGLTDL